MIIWDKCIIQNSQYSCLLTPNAGGGLTIGASNNLKDLEASGIIGNSLQIGGPNSGGSLIVNNTGVVVSGLSARFSTYTRFSHGLVIGDINNDTASINDQGAITGKSLTVQNNVTANTVTASTVNTTNLSGLTQLTTAQAQIDILTTNGMAVNGNLQAANYGSFSVKPVLWITSHADSDTRVTRACLITGISNVQFQLQVYNGTVTGDFCDANSIQEALSDWAVQPNEDFKIRFRIAPNGTPTDWFDLHIPEDAAVRDAELYINLDYVSAPEHLQPSFKTHSAIICKQSEIGACVCHWDSRTADDVRRIELWGWAAQQGYEGYYFHGIDVYYYYGGIQALDDTASLCGQNYANQPLPNYFYGVVTFGECFEQE